MSADPTAPTPATPAADPVLVPGTVLDGRYEIGETLGKGGSAFVFAGRDRKLGRPVAVKILHPDLAADPEARAEFTAEATAAALLNHPGIVAVHDTGIAAIGPATATATATAIGGTATAAAGGTSTAAAGGTSTAAAGGTPTAAAGGTPTPGAGRAWVSWIAMERVRGRTLHAILRDDPARFAAPADALALAADVLAALDHAHGQGVVHRDISRGNVMITDTATVKVVDFGLAVVGKQTERTEVVRGGVAFMSPEQAQGLPVDPRSDLYSVGCLLFTLLTGGPPYVADTVHEVARQHVVEPVPIASHRRADLPAAVDALLAWAMAKDPADRPASAQVMRDEVGRVRAALRGGAERVDRQRTQAMTAVPVPVTSVLPPVRADATPRLSAADRIAVPVPVVKPPPRATTPASQSVSRPPGQPPGRAHDRGGPWPAVVLTLLLVAGAALTVWLVRGPADEPAPVVVPDVTRQTEAEARDALTAADLAAGATRTEPHDTVPEGRVIRTDPPAGGRVAAGATIGLVVSSGPAEAPTVAVPQLDGATLAETRALLDRAGLVLGELRREDSARPADTVLATEPAAGAAAAPGSAVAVTLASGNQTVPDVVGSLVGDARGSLQNAGFGVAETFTTTTDAPGTVVAVQPGAGTSLRLGSIVTVVVAQPPVPTDAAPTPTPDPPETPDPSPTPTSPDPTATGPTDDPTATPTPP